MRKLILSRANKYNEMVDHSHTHIDIHTNMNTTIQLIETEKLLLAETIKQTFIRFTYNNSNEIN